MNTKPKPVFHPLLFLDVDIKKLDYNKKSAFIIERVFERGDVDDMRQCRRYYGDKKIRVVLLKAKHLSLKRIYLASAVINEPIYIFRCYISRLLNPVLYPY